MRLLLTGGGTGGHVYPALVVHKALRDLAPAAEPIETLYIGAPGSIEQRLAGQAGLAFEAISVGGLRGLGPLDQARNAVRLLGAFLKVRSILGRFRPNALLATGGYVSAAAIVACGMGGVPVVIYLPDLEPGLAIRRLSRWARRVAVSFPEAATHFEAEKAVVTGYPVRSEFYTVDRREARAHFQFDSNARVVTIFGGSRGAHSINSAVARHLETLLAHCQLIHLTGAQDLAEAESRRSSLPQELQARYVVSGYLDEAMHLALGAADLVVARAGAATLGEFPAVGVPSILVPYPYAGQHQDRNADYLVAQGAAVKLDDARLDTELAGLILRLLEDEFGRERMRIRAKELSRPEAAAVIARLLTEVAGL